jgi:hypothetical protein
MSTYVDRLTFLESLSWMTQPRDFPENPVRYRTDDVVKGVYVFQEHVDPATNPYPLPGEERDFVPCSLRVDPALLRGEASPEQIENVRRLIERLRADRPRGHFCLCPTCEGKGYWTPPPPNYPRWLEPILWLVAASSLAGFAYLVVRLIGG